MSETTLHDLSNVAETLLMTVYIRALESQRPDALLHDPNAVALVARLDREFARIRRVRMDEEDKVTVILRNLEFDRYARDFLARQPKAVVVHLGCGFDARFDRVDNGQVEWYDLDLPQVIELRRELIGGEGPRYHLLACSMFDRTWQNAVSADRPILFLAEGVFMYCREAPVKALVLALGEQFPGAELVFDTFSPLLVRLNNLRMMLAHREARYHWGLSRGHDVERWGAPGTIRLLDTWSYFDRPEPRLARVYWMRRIPFLARVLAVFHYRLGQALAATPG